MERMMNENRDVIEDETYTVELMTEIWDTIAEKAMKDDDIYEKNKQEFRDFIKRKMRR